MYPTREEYEAYYETHKTYVDHETGEIKETPHYEGQDGYGTTTYAELCQKLTDKHIAGHLSPMHIRDLLPDLNIKKPHWHLLVIYESKKNFETQVKPFFDELGGVGREEVGSLRGYARYLLHLDNPEKAQYEQQDITSFGGADYETTIHLPGDTMKAFNDIKAFINREGIIGYADLVDRLEVTSPELELVAVMKMAYPIKQYLKSKTWELRQIADNNTISSRHDEKGKQA